MSTNRPVFVLTLRPTPRSDDPSGMKRLRSALKALLRCYSLRCVRIDYPQDQADEGEPKEGDGDA